MIALKKAVEIASSQEKYMVLSKECYELNDRWCFCFAHKMNKGKVPPGGYSLLVYKETGKTKKVFLPSEEGFALLHEVERSGKEIDISEYIKELEK